MHLRFLYRMAIFFMTSSLFAGNAQARTFGKEMMHLWDVEYRAYLISDMNYNLSREKENEIVLETVVETEHEYGAPVPEVVPETTIQITEETMPVPTTVPETTVAIESHSEVQPEETAATEPSYVPPLYSVNGAVMPVEIQVYLYESLAARGIGWFFYYAVLIAYQESKFDIYAENPNGLDKGLLQYRIQYVPWMDWRNPYIQIDYFCDQMVNRANAGCTASEMISRHNTSDYGAYNQSYVDAVMQWEALTIKIQ